MTRKFVRLSYSLELEFRYVTSPPVEDLENYTHWEQEIHVVIHRKSPDSPVYDVEPENGTLHPNTVDVAAYEPPVDTTLPNWRESMWKEIIEASEEDNRPFS